jgi:hypothetical protein
MIGMQAGRDVQPSTFAFLIGQKSRGGDPSLDHFIHPGLNRLSRHAFPRHAQGLISL